MRPETGGWAGTLVGPSLTLWGTPHPPLPDVGTPPGGSTGVLMARGTPSRGVHLTPPLNVGDSLRSSYPTPIFG